MCDKCGGLMYDRATYTTMKCYKTIPGDNYYTKDIRIGSVMHFHNKCLYNLLSKGCANWEELNLEELNENKKKQKQ